VPLIARGKKRVGKFSEIATAAAPSARPRLAPARIPYPVSAFSGITVGIRSDSLSTVAVDKQTSFNQATQPSSFIASSYPTGVCCNLRLKAFIRHERAE
jgi:hypothetical protein